MASLNEKLFSYWNSWQSLCLRKKNSLSLEVQSQVKLKDILGVSNLQV